MKLLNQIQIKAAFKLSCFFILLIVLFSQEGNSQKYLGVGVHFAPLVQLDNCCNEFVETKGLLMPAESYLFKKKWKNAREKAWYYEIGLTKMGVRYNYTHYTNDPSNLTPWIEFSTEHLGFPSILYGTGRIFPLKKKHKEIHLGLETSLLISNTLGELSTSNFRLLHSTKDIPFPLYLRLNLGHTWHFKVFKHIPAHIQVYSKFSFQNIAKGRQFIENSATNVVDTTGKYSLNNSEIGITFFVDIGKEHYKFEKREKKEKPKSKRNKNFPSRFRFSIEGQVYAPKSTKYFIPQVDSFLLEGLKLSFSNQIGIKSEFIHRKNDNWSTLVGLGFGPLRTTTRFKVGTDFAGDSLAIDQFQGDDIGHYLLAQVGFAFKHKFFKVWLQHSLSFTVAYPFIADGDAKIQIPELSSFGLPENQTTFIVDGQLLDTEYINPIFSGLEYQAELLFKLDKKIFFGIGTVFHLGLDNIRHGPVKVDNGRTQYYGGVQQGFGKIGISARIGYNFNQ